MKRILILLAFGSAVSLYLTSCGGDVRGGQTFNYMYCAPGFDPEDLKKEGAPLFTGLGDLHYEVTTKSKKAQQYF
jgi:hypothetical protein